jgi:transcriptional regulator GlxA family with amidase domain
MADAFPDLSGRRFGFLCYPGFEELDLIGPWEMATMWSSYACGPACVTVAADHAPVSCAKGLTVVAGAAYADCPPLDYLLVPGGFAAFEVIKDPALIGFVRRQAATARAVLSVCTGSFILNAAGLLDGRRATTHWKCLPRLREAPGVTVEEARWTRDGPVWTSAGVSAGMDLLLAFIAAEAGEAAASEVQWHAEYYPEGHTYGVASHSDDAPAYLKASA